MRHMLAGENVALATTRAVEIGGGFRHVFCSNTPIQHHAVSTKEVNFLFPLYLYPQEGLATAKGGQYNLIADEGGSGPGGRRPNLNPRLIADVEKRLGLSFTPDGRGELEVTFGPQDIFDYVYAILHSPTYRSRYVDFFRLGFPRIPLTSDIALFRTLVDKGGQLAGLHLMVAPALHGPIVRYPVTGANIVEARYPRYVAPAGLDTHDGGASVLGRVYISSDDARTGARGQYFEGISPDVWEFEIGGTQVCRKWLEDRRGLTLSLTDLVHYQGMVTAVAETIRLMNEIDNAIPSWPIV